jgi:hypothetical protein
MAALISAAFALLCVLCVTPGAKPLRMAEHSTPYVSFADDGDGIERGTSAGFFVPTAENVTLRVSMPTLKYDIGPVDAHTVSVFRDTDRQQIVGELHPMDDVMSDNILGPIHISAVRNLSDVYVYEDRPQLENILSGDRFSVGGPLEVKGGFHLLFCKIGNFWFSSPAEVCSFPVTNENFIGIQRAALKPIASGESSTIGNIGNGAQ